MDVGGARYFPGWFDAGGQRALLMALRAVIAEAPLYQPRMPKSGKPFSVRMTNCGPLGWVSDIEGYRYQPTHPVTGKPWPSLPAIVLQAWEVLAGYPHPPEACLINYYAAGTRMGLHQDKDEADFSAPVVSLSLGDAAPGGRHEPERPDALVPPQIRRRNRAWRQGPPRLPRRRPNFWRNVRPPAGRRTLQSYSAARASARRLTTGR